MNNDRARAVIVKTDEILLIQRDRAGEIYYVLPGGHIEKGESPELAVLREVREETSLEVKISEKLNVIIDKTGTNHHIYLCQYISGIPHLAKDSPESSKDYSGDDTYTPMWIKVSELKDIAMWPSEVKPLLVSYFKL